MTALEILFHPIWVLVWHWGAGVFIIIALIAGFVWVPAILVPKQYWLYAAGAVALVLVAYGVGIVDQKHLDAAQEKVIDTKVDNAVTKSGTPASKASPDRWDRKDY